MVNYGQTSEEVKADEMSKARQIVSEILDFGVSQAQLIQIIKLLGLEIANHHDSRTIVTAALSIQKSDAVVIEI